MTISERLFETMKTKKITQEEIANATGTKQSTIANWKNRGTTPPMEYLPTICETLDISWEFLVTGEESQAYLTAEEKEIITQYRNTNDTGKQKIKEYIKDIAQFYPMQKE